MAALVGVGGGFFLLGQATHDEHKREAGYLIGKAAVDAYNLALGNYVTSWRQFEMLSGVERAIAPLNQASRKVIVVTNQPGIALRRLSEPDLLSIYGTIQVYLETSGAHIDSVYYCPHDYGQCSCRKAGDRLV
jgi:HAD superfamily hydrolase (TIGR01662 family)